jgi:TfoX/Sxy family transcriptional regulator of competence genes
MAYDELLADRVRQCFEGVDEAEEKKMFGGLCFLIGGNMACGVTSKGPLMVRVGPEAYEQVLAEAHARPMDFTGRPLRGLVYVDEEGYRRDSDLRAWVERGISFAASLPRK